MEWSGMRWSVPSLPHSSAIKQASKDGGAASLWAIVGPMGEKEMAWLCHHIIGGVGDHKV